MPFVPPPASPLTFWAQGFGAWGTFGGHGNAAIIDRRLGGAVVGVDRRFGDGGQLGFAAGFSEAKINVNARQSAATVDSAHVALYGGQSFGVFNLRAGAAYAQHRIDTSRAILFPGFADRATANYDGGTGQVFGEIGYGLALGNVAIEPFAGLAWVRADTHGFTETGGPAALAGRSSSSETGTSTLGARFATSFALTNGMALAPRLSAAWQHAFDDVTPAAALAFAGGGPNFTIAGVPLAQDSALFEAGFDLRLTPNATMGVSYLGQFAGRVDDHAVKGKLLWNF
jgi:outer membrane autotransporter protein